MKPPTGRKKRAFLPQLGSHWMGRGDIRTGTLALPCHLDVVGHGQLDVMVYARIYTIATVFFEGEEGRKVKDEKNVGEKMKEREEGRKTGEKAAEKPGFKYESPVRNNDKKEYNNNISN